MSGVNFKFPNLNNFIINGTWFLEICDGIAVIAYFIGNKTSGYSMPGLSLSS